jgi:hypothetical protein
MKISMRILPLKACKRARNICALIGVKFCRKGVVRNRRHCWGEQAAQSR